MPGSSFHRVAGWFLFGALGIAQTSSVAPIAATAEGTAFFEKNIRPLLATHCYSCHSTKLAQPASGLLLDSQAGMLRGGKSGIPAILAGKPEESLLIAAVRRVNKDLQMPPAKPLEPFEIDYLIDWIKMGAPDPRTDPIPAAAPPPPAYDWDKARKHWAFRPIRDSKPPWVAQPEWRESPVDRFVKSKLDAKGLLPEPRAGKLALIRRATFDLTGLPPTPDEVDAFLKDKTPRAFEKVVDRLLASPRYGERWGRHWLDVVRYADTAGDNADFPVPAMYRYRNWVIAAFKRTSLTTSFCVSRLRATSWRRKTIWWSATKRSGSRKSSPPAIWPTRGASGPQSASFISPSTTPSTTSDAEFWD
jgi:hypothetical protein